MSLKPPGPHQNDPMALNLLDDEYESLSMVQRRLQEEMTYKVRDTQQESFNGIPLNANCFAELKV